MQSFIKYPRGKSREINQIRNMIPNYSRYIEPFFGGGAVFFDLMPKKAAVNDISVNLMDFYSLIQKEDKVFYKYLLKYDNLFQCLVNSATDSSSVLVDAYNTENDSITEKAVDSILKKSSSDTELIPNMKEYRETVLKNVRDKFRRTHRNSLKKPFSSNDLKENLITEFTGGLYIYFRNIYNDINLGKIKADIQYKIANFYFIREYCYGSMFRYNQNNEFNVPYGGMSYNRKNFRHKIDSMFSSETVSLLNNAELYNLDFEDFMDRIQLSENDFMFLDPPYDTDFSSYENRSFNSDDQIRLCSYLKKTPAPFILIIKNTDFIYNLYKDDFNIKSFDKKYAYNIKCRNIQDVKHLIISNMQLF